MPFQLWFFSNVPFLMVAFIGLRKNKLLKEKLSENHQTVTTCGQYQDELHVNGQSGGDRICIQLLIPWAIQLPER